MSTKQTAGAIYTLIAEKLSSAVAPRELTEMVAEVATSEEFSVSRFSESQDVLRMLQRLGLAPNTRVTKPNQARLSALVDEAAQSARVSPHSVRVSFLLYSSPTARFAPGPICGPEPRCEECALTAHCRRFQRRPSIKELPENLRPRERFIRGEHLSDAELVAILIRSGTSKASAMELAQRLLAAYDGQLHRLADLGIGEALDPQTKKVSGIGPTKLVQVKAALELARRLQRSELTPGRALVSSRDVFDHLKDQMRGEKKETVTVLLLDNKQRVIRAVSEKVSMGSLTASIVHPREAFKPAIRESAAAVIFVHNHPSGDESPSKDDIEITRRLKEAGEIIGIKVLDHIIIGRDSYTSFADRGLL